MAAKRNPQRYRHATPGTTSMPETHGLPQKLTNITARNAELRRSQGTFNPSCAPTDREPSPSLSRTENCPAPRPAPTDRLTRAPESPRWLDAEKHRQATLRLLGCLSRPHERRKSDGPWATDPLAAFPPPASTPGSTTSREQP